MKATITEGIEIPEGIQIQLEHGLITVQGSRGTIQRKVSLPGISITKDNHNLVFSTPKGTLREKRMIKTTMAHVNSMMHGVNEGFVYELKICSGHFPMNVSTDGKTVIIKNFLGEKVPRKASIIDGVTVRVEGDKVICEGSDKENVSQTAARIETATKIKGRDRRVFQDGIYVTIKAGEPIR